MQNLKSIDENVLKDEFVYGCLKDEEVIAQVMVEWNNFQNILNTTLLSFFFMWSMTPGFDLNRTQSQML